jgi:hypothetical protein
LAITTRDCDLWMFEAQVAHFERTSKWDQASGSTWGNRDHAYHQGDISRVLANSTKYSSSIHVSLFKKVFLDLTQRGFIPSINCSHSLSGSCRGGAATPFADAMFPFRSPLNPEKQQENGGIFVANRQNRRVPRVPILEVQIFEEWFRKKKSMRRAS